MKDIANLRSIRNPVMCLITAAQMKALRSAGRENMVPIIKLFGGPLTWLVTEIDDDEILWGYADLSMQCVEFGSLCHVSELPTMKCGIGFLERDYHFTHKPGAKYLEMDSLTGI